MKDKFQSKFVPRGTRTIWRYLGALFILFTFAIGQMWGAETTIFSASCKVSSDVTVTKGTTDQAVTSAQADVTGGSLYVSNGETSDKKLLLASAGPSGNKKAAFTITNGKTIFKIVLTQALQAGDVISSSFNVGSDKEGDDGLWFSTSSSRPSSEPATKAVKTTPSGWNEVSYTVATSDGICGETTFYVHRATGTSTYFPSLTITREGGDDPEPEDTTAPTLASSVPANAATNVAVSGNIVLTFSEAINTVDASKFKLTGATIGTVAIDGTDAKKVNVPYSGAENEATVTLAVAAEAVGDAAGNKSDALSDISFTTVAAEIVPDYLLINQSTGDVNTAQFRTTSTSSSKAYTVEGTDFAKYIQLGGAFATPVGVYETNKIIAYDAKTNSVTVQAWIYNKASSTDYKFYISMIEEGATTPTIKEFDAPRNKGTKAIWTFSPSKNATIYVHVGNNSNVHICQVGITESGAALLQGGAIGYSVNLSSCRLADNKTSLVMDGIEYKATSNAVKVLTTGNPVKLKSTSEYIKFTLAETEKVSIGASGTYSVTNSAAYDEDKAISDNQDVVLAAGTWYICPNGSNVSFSSLSFLAPPTAYKVNYAAGSFNETAATVKTGKELPKHADAIEGEKITLASGENLQCAGADFAGWKANGTGELLKVGDEYTMTNADVEFVAQWTEHVAKYTVKYMDGEEVLGSEDVIGVTNHPDGLAADPTKALNSFAGWQLSGEDVALNAITGTDGATVTLTAKWTKLYAADGTVNFADDANDGALAEFLPTGYACGNLGKDSKWGKENEGDVYFGYKLKNADAYVELRVVAGKRVTFVFGNYAQAGTIKVGDAAAENCTLTADSKYVVNTDAEAVIRFTTTSGGTVTLKSITVADKPAASDDVELGTLSYKLGEGEPVAISIVVGKTTYNVALPYKTITVPVVSYTANDANATAGEVTQATSVAGLATFTVTAEDGVHSANYTVNFSVADKDMLCLIKATHVAAKTATVEGSIGGNYDKNTQGGGKLGDTGHYFGIKLAEGTFQAGDVLVITATVLNNGNATVFTDKGETELASGAFDEDSKTFTYELTAEAEWIYLYRKTDACNPQLGSMAVYRPYPTPLVETIAINSIDMTVDNTASPKTITGAMPNGTNFGELSVSSVTFLSNNPALTNGVLSGAWDGTAKQYEGTYTVTDKDDDVTTYNVVLTEDVAVESVSVSGETTVMEGSQITLSAAVLPVEVANKAVTWSSSDETKATVDANGVVTGKAAGIVTITATSQADGNKQGTKVITISENRCKVWSNPASYTETYTLGKMKVAPTGLSTLQSDVIPFKDAAVCKAWKLDAKNTKYAEISFTDNAQFESLYVGVTSKDNDKNYNFAVVCSSAAGGGFETGILSKATYEATDKDDEFASQDEAMIEVNLPLGTKVVRIYRQYTDDFGGGSSVYLYRIEACKKELVPLVGVTIVNANLAQGRSITPVLALNPTNADVASVTWSFDDAEAATAAGLTINAATGEVSATAEATEGDYTVKATVTDALSNVKVGTGTITVISAYPQANVTESIVWDWSASCWNGKANTEMTGGDIDADILMANAGPDIVNSNEFRSDMLIVNGQYAWRSEGSGKEYFQGTSIKFTTAVAGIVRVSYRGTGNGKKIRLTINGQDAGTNDQGFAWCSYIEVPVGEVTIVGTGIEGYTGYARIQKIEFVEIGYPRSGLNPANIGTICLPNGGIMKGATLYKMLGKDSNHKLNFEDVEGNRLEAGNPYIFVPEAGRTQVNVYYTDNANVLTAGEDHGLVGTFDPLSTIDDGENSPLWGNYIISNNKYILVDSNNCRISANRAYIRNIYDDSKVPYINSNAAPAPGRKRLVIGAGAPQVATGIGDVQGDEVQSSKVLINGQLFILRGEKMYDATGRLVK